MTDTPSTPPGEPTDAYPPVPGYESTAGQTETLTEERRGNKRGVVIGVGAAVLAVIAGAAVYATTALSGGGTQPDEVLPKSTFAFAKVDLDPAANQKLAARAFFNKFPDLKTENDDTNVFEDLIERMLRDDPDIKYDTDIKPWFDKRAAIAAFNGAGGVKVVGALRSKNDGKAREALDRLKAKAKEDGSDLSYRIEKGYVLVSEKQADVDEAATLSDKESLSDNETYTADVDELNGDQVAVGWVDTSQAFDAIKQYIPNIGLIPNAAVDQIKGRFVSGAHFNNDYVEIEGMLLGGSTATTPTVGAVDLMKKLPANTFAAVSVNGLNKILQDALGGAATAGFDPQQLLDQYLGQAGVVNLQNDVLPLFGAETVLALGSFPGREVPKFGLESTVADAAKARAAGEKIAALLTGLSGGELKVDAEVSGNTFYLATGGYVADLKGNSGLGDAARFKKAMGDLGGDIAAAGYLDLEPIVAALDENGDVGALKAIGIVSGMRGGTGYFRLRVVAE